MSGETCATNSMSVSLTILELLEFNAPTVWLTGSMRADTQTDAQSDENIISAIHSVYLVKLVKIIILQMLFSTGAV